jgi:hypothetical protein
MARRPSSIQELPATIPLFPLQGALLFPRSRLPLNIFEPRYLTLIDDVLRSDHRLIGMVQPLTNTGRGGAAARWQRVGCAGRLTRMTETDDGRYLVTLSGLIRFRILADVPGFKPYYSVEVGWDGFEGDFGAAETETGFDKPRFLKVLAKYFEHSRLAPDWDSLKEAEEEQLINSISMLCPFAPDEKQALLEAPTLPRRRETLEALMEFAVRSGKGGGMVQ